MLGDEIGKGAYGRVYKGLDLENGDFVAIKQISLENIPQEDLNIIMVNELNYASVPDGLSDLHYYFLFYGVNFDTEPAIVWCEITWIDRLLSIKCPRFVLTIRHVDEDDPVPIGSPGDTQSVVASDIEQVSSGFFS
ncbi:hypothetical protein QYE76_048395 [Lolium multiflorum]|uniref:Protein kinase domain-containing protein n=1 Tax=Lolium multiflorum TaxID=4521 RepID=A0AAD8WFU9_LOLMU|nr:hypothetical protein QYE76_048395 [Lolium multiflorum]